MLQARGVRVHSAHFVVYVMRAGDAGRIRLGITVSSRIGNAVVRNRIKRQVRECFRRRLRALMPAESAMIVIAKRGAEAIDSSTLADELTSAIRSAGRKF